MKFNKIVIKTYYHLLSKGNWQCNTKNDISCKSVQLEVILYNDNGRCKDFKKTGL